MNTFQIKRRITGAAGAPASLKSGELAWNQVDSIIYGGFGDDGNGNATSIVPVAGDGHFAETSDLGGLGYGDMLKSVYDTGDNGKVDVAELAESVAYVNITGLPSEFTPAPFDASKITSGTIDVARIPASVFQAPVVSTGGLGALTTPQQDAIVEGTTVTTSDGIMYQYTGSGSKTAAGSYVELADRTPDWSQIANKPTTFTPSAHTHTLADITDSGTMASQAASAVAITGGTIDGIILDGGTF